MSINIRMVLSSYKTKKSVHWVPVPVRECLNPKTIKTLMRRSGPEYVKVADEAEPRPYNLMFN
jgi:hypothetical protein